MTISNLKNKIESTYGVPFDSLLVSNGNKRYAVPVPNSDKVLYGFVVKNESDGEPVFTFAFDSFVTDYHIALSLLLPVDFKSPALNFNLNVPLEEILSKVKTKKSLVSGERWSRIQHTTVAVTEDNIKDFFDRKRITYPTANSAHERYLTAQGYKGWLTTGTVDGQFLYTMLWYSNSVDYCGTHIVVTEDAALRSRYSPYVVGHLWLVRFAHEKKGSIVRFSLFYSYKAIFGQPPSYYPTIDVKNLASVNAQEF